jgi:type I restriction-modification system DNA methylase subunit
VRNTLSRNYWTSLRGISNKLLLYKKTQKLLDRFLFILFAEDRLLLPPNSIREIIKQWERFKEEDEYFPLYDRFKKYFNYLNIGHKGKTHEIFAYNGGLFEADEVLDNIKIDDQILFTHTHKLSDYDYQSDVDVNILGHIFEHSLNEIEEVQAELEGQTIEKNKTKRKKDGIFYTPKYITKYIVDKTLGSLCDEKKKELQINEDEFSYTKRKAKRKELIEILESYRNWLLKLTICDPACGSGAFLNQALNYLIEEHKIIDELQAKVSAASIVFPDIENKILENNLYGVDLNDESIEIAKLSLWLRTAQKGRKLTSLNKNIKCGNSLIDDKAIAGEKAFNWKNEFPEIFANGGFDIVIGNPPYTYRNAILEIEKDFFKKNYSSTEGNFDLYKFFIEKLNIISKQNGYSSLIVPNTFLSAITYKKLREIIVNEFRIIEFFDLGLNVFENVVVESIIFTFCKQKVSIQNTQIKIDRERTGKFFSLEKSYMIDLLKYYSKDHSFNINLSSELDTIINKCQLNSIELGKIAYCTVGINTGYIKEELTSNNKVDDRYHKMLNGKNIGRNFVDWDEEWIMYDVDFVKSKGDKGRALPPEYVFLKEKILVQRTRRGMKRKLVCYYDTEQYYNLNRISNIVSTNDDYSLKYIYVLLNSELLDFYFNKYFNEYEVKPVHLAKLPIKILNLELQKSFTEKADIMLSKNKELQEIKTKFIKLFISKYNDLKITNKLEDWINLDFNSFSKELQKQKIKLSLTEQSEWLEYFEKEKAKAIELQNEINKTDKEIDDMVYELYGLTEEERKIIKNN